MKILVVDDEPMISSYLEETLTEMGYEVSGTAATCAAALESIWQNKPDIALVDAWLGNETCEAVIEECRNLGIGIIVSSGMAELPDCCDGYPTLTKPYGDQVLAEALGEWRSSRQSQIPGPSGSAR